MHIEAEKGKLRQKRTHGFCYETKFCFYFPFEAKIFASK